jgi:Ion channel
MGFAALIHFGFVILASTGYGDILPSNLFARSLAKLESIVGRLYPATLLATLLAQHLEQRHR